MIQAERKLTFMFVVRERCAAVSNAEALMLFQLDYVFHLYQTE